MKAQAAPMQAAPMQAQAPTPMQVQAPFGVRYAQPPSNPSVALQRQLAASVFARNAAMQSLPHAAYSMPAKPAANTTPVPQKLPAVPKLAIAKKALNAATIPAKRPASDISDDDTDDDSDSEYIEPPKPAAAKVVESATLVEPTAESASVSVSTPIHTQVPDNLDISAVMTIRAIERHSRAPPDGFTKKSIPQDKKGFVKECFVHTATGKMYMREFPL